MKASTALWALLALDLAAIATVLGVAWQRGGVVFFATFFGLIVLPWLAAYAALGPRRQKKQGVQVQDIPLADEATARAQALEQHRAGRKEVTIAGVAGFLLSEERPVVFMPADSSVLRLYQAPDRATLEQYLSRKSPGPPDLLDRLGVGRVFAGAAVYTLLVAGAFIFHRIWYV